MLSSIKTLKGYKLEGLDGEIGKVKEFYFDDRYWTVRYLVAETSWLLDRQVLISPYALIGVHEDVQNIGIDLTKQQIEDSPILETDRPVSQQFEGDYNGYYGWPAYWKGTDVWGAYPYIMRDRKSGRSVNSDGKSWDPFLRSTDSVRGHSVQAEDGEVGHIEDFIIDDETWTIRYLVMNTRFWLPGKRILISPQWVDRVSWSESKVFVNVSCESIGQSPEYTESSLPTREYETSLYSYYSRQGYWIGHSSTQEQAAHHPTGKKN